MNNIAELSSFFPVLWEIERKRGDKVKFKKLTINWNYIISTIAVYLKGKKSRFLEVNKKNFRNHNIHDNVSSNTRYSVDNIYS